MLHAVLVDRTLNSPTEIDCEQRMILIVGKLVLLHGICCFTYKAERIEDGEAVVTASRASTLKTGKIFCHRMTLADPGAAARA